MIEGQSFDALDRLIEVTDPALNDATYAYDERDNPQVTDPDGVTTSYVYDGLDNLIQESSPDAGTTVHEYDAAGNLTETTDGRGIVVEYAYDALNRLTAITYPGSPGEDVTYTYDTGTNGVGRLRSVTDAGGTTTYTYDDRGNVLSESRATRRAWCWRTIPITPKASASGRCVTRAHQTTSATSSMTRAGG